MAAPEVLTPPGDRTWLVAYLRFRNEILDAPETTETDPHPETVNAFRQIWQGALEIGRKGEADKTAEARAEVEALSREAARNRVWTAGEPTCRDSPRSQSCARRRNDGATGSQGGTWKPGQRTSQRHSI